MTNNVNFDELARKSFAPDAGPEDYEKLFGAVFSLPEWHFIPDGEFPNITPYCALFPDFFGDQPAVAVFTDSERARKFMAESQAALGSSVTGSSEDLVLTVPTTNILDYIENLIPKGIVKIFFNPNKDSHGFSHDIKMMRPIREHLESKGLLSKPETKSIEPVETQSAASSAESAPQTTTPDNEKTNASANLTDNKSVSPNQVDFDDLSRKANDSGGAIEVLNNLFGAAYALPEWQFIARGELPNVNPYVAANAAYADNQPMVRAFTDGERLMRFAKENNLTKPDGSCDILTIPTSGIIEYLEQFIQYGVHGVWFNSDAQSDGFFIPLKQLQPIKEHLAKLKQSKLAEQKASVQTIQIIVKDGLMLPSGFVSQADYTCNFYCRVPSDWLDSEKLKEEHLENVYKKVYGDTWRSGNGDGSRYIVIDSSTKILTTADLKNTKWGELKTTPENQYWFYVIGENNEIKSLKADEFQKEIDASLQTATTDEARRRQDNLADYGMSQTADGEFDLNLSINQVGAINFDTSIAPFYETIVPLLKDYQGTGEYAVLLRFEPSGKSQEVENIVENEHGTYLQIRRFLYLNPKNNVRIGVNSIHSNYLRHVQSNAELIVSFELCKNLDNQTGVFYHRFEGPKSDVLRLSAAIQPILESNNYEAVQ